MEPKCRRNTAQREGVLASFSFQTRGSNGIFLHFQVEVCPCSPDGKEYTEQDDMFVDNPNELIGQELYFLFKILGCRGIPARFTVTRFQF